MNSWGLIIVATGLVGLAAGWLRLKGWWMVGIAGAGFLFGLIEALSGDPTDDTRGLWVGAGLTWAIVWLNTVSGGLWLRALAHPRRGDRGT